MLSIFIGQDHKKKPVLLQSSLANRHGLIAGATGTGKTLTLQNLVEQLSAMGVPVFTADVKGDLSGLSQKGSPQTKIEERAQLLNLTDFRYEKFPCTLWDIYAEKGLPLRTTVSAMGPLLLSQILQLSDVQSDVLSIAFKYSKDQKLPLFDLKDLQALLGTLSEQSKELQSLYGSLNKTTLGTLIRKVIHLGDSGGSAFFGEPALKVKDLLRTDNEGRGMIHILDAQKLMLDRRLYSSFLLWLLSDLFESLEEVGNPEKPRLVFFFDEAHLLFDETPSALLEKIETVVRLIRSKGVGIYFITQNPTDIPVSVLGQLGNRIQHALRVFSEKDKKAVQAAAETFALNPEIDAKQMITQLGTGETLVSVLNEKGTPQPVVHVINAPPRTRVGPITEKERQEVLESSPYWSEYGLASSTDSLSAFEILSQKKNSTQKYSESKKEYSSESLSRSPEKSNSRQSHGEAFLKSLLRTVAHQLGRILVQSIKKSLTKR